MGPRGPAFGFAASASRIMPSTAAVPDSVIHCQAETPKTPEARRGVRRGGLPGQGRRSSVSSAATGRGPGTRPGTSAGWPGMGVPACAAALPLDRIQAFALARVATSPGSASLARRLRGECLIRSPPADTTPPRVVTSPSLACAPSASERPGVGSRGRIGLCCAPDPEDGFAGTSWRSGGHGRPCLAFGRRRRDDSARRNGAGPLRPPPVPSSSWQ